MNKITTLFRYFNFSLWSAGTMHWFVQRVISAAMIPLSLVFLVPFSYHYNFEYERLIDLYRSPIWSGSAFVVLSATMIHFRLGIQEVIEDYVHSSKMKSISLIVNDIISGGVILCLFIFVAKIVYENNWVVA